MKYFLIIIFLFNSLLSFSQLPNTIYDIVSNSPDHNTLEVAIDECLLDEVLSGPGPFTLLAPTDAAFNLLPAGTVEALLSDIPQFTNILMHHLVDGSVMSSMISNNQVLTTMHGTDITVTINSNGVFVDYAQVIVADIIADNGVVHVIDAVLLPPVSLCDNYSGLYCEDFDSYQEGDLISEVSTEISTWSGNPLEDVNVSGANSYSGNNSLFFEAAADANPGGPQDIIIPFGQVYENGLFSFSTRFLIPSSGTGAYFNFQSDNEVGSTYAFDCYFESNGIVNILNDSSFNMLSAFYPQDEWFNLELKIDLTQNNWVLKINDIVLGSFENYNNRVASVDFYPLGGNQFYIDDVTFNHYNSSSNFDSPCGNAFYCEDFENVTIPSLPNDMNAFSLENNYYVPVNGSNVQVQGFYVGNSEDAGVGGYWNYIPEHTQFAMTNDDACLPGGSAPTVDNNCDLTFEVLQLPSLDFTGQENLWLKFDYFHDKNWGGGDAFVEISIDNGVSFQESILLTETSQPFNWQKELIDLSNYNDYSNVVIRFRWSDNGTWASGLAIDDIIIGPLPEYSFEVNNYNHSFSSNNLFDNSTYTIAPLLQAQSAGYDFSTQITNTGANILSNTYANFIVGSFGVISDLQDVQLNSTNTFTASEKFYPQSVGVYEAAINAYSNPIISQYESISFEVSEYEYARDHAADTDEYDGGDFVGLNGSEQRGNVFEIFEDATIYSIKVRVHPATTLGCIAKGVLNMVQIFDDGSPDDYFYIDETPEIDIGYSTDGWTNLIFDTPIDVTAGDMVLPTIQNEYNGFDTLVIGYSGISNPGVTMLNDIDGVYGDPGGWYSINNTPMIRLSFEPVVVGCTDMEASNYDSLATSDNGSCIFCSDFSSSIITSDATSTESCDALAIVEINGGQEPFIYQWNGIETSNISYLCPGVNVLTVIDGNNCLISDTIFIGPEDYGCMDTNACNYDEYANIQDNSCLFPLPFLDCNFNCINDIDQDGICDEEEIFGCTNSDSPNFNNTATEDDGSCIECNIELEYFSANTSSSSDCNGIIGITVNNSMFNYTVYVNNIELSSNYNTNTCFGDNLIYVEDEQGCYISDNFFMDADVIYGCTNPLATNFNDLANSDDGTCEFDDLNNPCDIIPSNIYVDNIIHNRISFNWSAPIIAPSHYMIRYRPVGAIQWTVISAGPQTPAIFNGTSRTRFFMEPSTTYEWSMRARLLNGDGTTNCQSPWSANSQYTTLPACANLENLSVSKEANWVTFFADAPDASWEVWQSKGKMREIGINAYRYVNGNSNGDINVLKGNFNASTDYEWHTKAWCTGNLNQNGAPDPMYHSGWGDFSPFRTEDPCDKMPTNLTTSSNGGNTAVIMSWDTPENGAPDHYFLELTNTTTGQQFQWNNIPGTATSKAKYNQNIGDVFAWKIRGACGTNGTSWATSFSETEYYILGGARLENEELTKVELSPNPSRGIFNVSFEVPRYSTVDITIANYLGKEVYSEQFNPQEDVFEKSIDISSNANGIYLLTIKTNTGLINKRVVIQ